MSIVAAPHRHLYLFGILLFLGSCQGTPWGQRIESALQAPQVSESADLQPTGIPVMVESPETPDSLENIDDLDPEPTPDLDLSLSSSSPSPAVDLEDPEPTGIPRPDSTRPPRGFEDLTDLDPVTQAAVDQLQRLGVLDTIAGSPFEPDLSIRRGEFAQWLVLANNALHQRDPSRQIRLAPSSERPIFLDVPEDHPQFQVLQALGAAGLIEGDDNQEFRPESLLSRAELVRITVPILLPPGSLPVEGSQQALMETWGFVDADRIPEAAIPAIIADRDGDPSLIRQTFGLIRTFNPQDPVSRAEAALALSLLGSEPEPTPTPDESDQVDPDELGETDPVETSEPTPDPTPTEDVSNEGVLEDPLEELENPDLEDPDGQFITPQN